MSENQIPALAMPLNKVSFCSIDLETTGIGSSDRIVELAAVVTDASGAKTREMHTIVDPRVTLASFKGEGAGWSHGITDTDLVGAPTFSDLLAELNSFISGSILVAHNAPFVMRMLNTELSLGGFVELEVPFINTQTFRSRVGLEGAGGKPLAWHCWQEGIALPDGNPTVLEARAVAQLVNRYRDVAIANELPTLGDVKSADAAAKSWRLPLPPPLDPPSLRPILKQRDGVPIEPSGLGHGGKVRPAKVAKYRKALSDAMEDFELTAEENATLQRVAEELGLSAEEVKTAHEGHLMDLVKEQADDKVFSWVEQQIGLKTASLLAVPAERLSEMMVSHNASVEGEVAEVASAGLLEGLTVCFTGEFTAMPMTRKEVQAHAEETA